MKFNWQIYRELNPDLVKAGLKTKNDFERHYIIHANIDKRNWNLYNIYPTFNPIAYKNRYSDLSNINTIEGLELHWIMYGRHEGREYTSQSGNYNTRFNIIDKILYINLDSREDRKNEIEKQFVRANIPSDKFHRISADYNKLGALGCTSSHIKCLKYAIQNNFMNVLILEDDFNFIENIDTVNDSIQNIVNFGNDWDVIFFSGNVHKCVPFNSTFDRALDVQCASGYLVNSRYYLKLLNNFEKGYRLFSINKTPQLYAVDMYWKILQPLDKWYIFSTKIGYQRESYSDIEKKIVNYRC
jgi:glycosyl transferase family 25